jgi:type IV pilus assembly protein PilE
MRGGRSARGFTLIELLVVTSIVAMLASFAWSAMHHSLQRARRADAHRALLRIRHAQEAFFARHNRYADQLGSGADTPGLGLELQSDAGFYAMQLRVAADGQSYVASASANADGPQYADRDCRQLVVDDAGNRSVADSTGRQLAADSTCW